MSFINLILRENVTYVKTIGTKEEGKDYFISCCEKAGFDLEHVGILIGIALYLQIYSERMHLINILSLLVQAHP